MNVVKCKNGHYFDRDSFEVCPTCGAPVSGSEAEENRKNKEKTDFHLSKAFMKPGPQNQVSEDYSKLGSLTALMSVDDFNNHKIACDYELNDHDCFVVVCDGTGEKRSGIVASETAKRITMEAYLRNKDNPSVTEWMKSAIKESDEGISEAAWQLWDVFGMTTTLVQVLIRDKQLYWSSVGDSRIYICRNDQFVQLTTDYNYVAKLKRKYDAGLISAQFYMDELKQSNRIENYLGRLNADDMCLSAEPFLLQKGDIIVLVTSGLCHILDDKTIMDELQSNDTLTEMAKALNALAEYTVLKRGINRHNRKDSMAIVLFAIG